MLWEAVFLECGSKQDDFLEALNARNTFQAEAEASVGRGGEKKQPWLRG